MKQMLILTTLLLAPLAAFVCNQPGATPVYPKG
jgi:hypothetical protein